MRVTMKRPCLGFGKLFNVLQSLIGRMASRPMRNIETFPSKQMYLYLSLVERKVAEFYHNTWLKWLVFIAFYGQLMVSLIERDIPNLLLDIHKSFHAGAYQIAILPEISPPQRWSIGRAQRVTSRHLAPHITRTITSTIEKPLASQKNSN